MSDGYCEAVGACNAHIRWAMAAIEAGDPADALVFLRRAQESMEPVFPSIGKGPSEFYIPRKRGLAA